jgi:HEAT repeat protein
MKVRIFVGLSKFLSRARANARTEIAKIALIICSLSFAVPSSTFALSKALQQAATNISDVKLTICLPAIEKLGHSKDASAAAPLISAFASEQRPLVRRYIVDALGLLKNNAAIPTLGQALQDTDIQIRQSAVAALSLIGSPAAHDLLIKAAGQEKEAAVKTHLAHALGHSSHPKASEALKKLTSDADPDVRRLANSGLQNQQKQKEAK